MRHSHTWLCVIALTGSAYGDEVDAKAQARSHAEEATRLFKETQYDEAAAAYQQAYAADPQPIYLYATAQAQRLNGDCTAAVRSYRDYLETKPAASDETKARANIERCEPSVSRQGALERPVLAAADIEIPRALLTSDPMITTVHATRRPWTKAYAGHALVGGGLAVAAAGVGFYLKARGTLEAAEAATTYEEFARARASADGARTNHMIGVSTMAIGSGLIIGGLIHYVLRARTVTATVSSDQARLVVTRSF